MKKPLLFLILLPLISLGQKYNTEIDSIVSSKFNNGPAISVLVSENYIPVYTKIKGKANLENDLQATSKSKFRIGSVTKQFTAIAILKLMEDGKLNLNDKIQKYLPSFPLKTHSITIKHLLSHSSGLKEVTELPIFYTQLMKNGCAPDSLVNYFKDYDLEFQPGSKFQYNNSGYHLLGLIIEKVSGLAYNDYINKTILSLAGMKNTVADNGKSIIKNRVSGYEEVNNTLVNSTYIDMSIPYSAGNLLSTAEDLNLWYKALFEYKIVSKNILKKAHQAYQLNDGSFTKYGYGWFVDSLQGEKVISHEGGVNGFLSSVWFVPSSKTLTLLLSNCLCNPTVNTAKNITAQAIGRPFAQKKRIKLSQKELEKYEGTYLMDGEEWTVSIVKSDLYFSFGNGNGHAIYSLNKQEFFAEEWDSKFVFIEKKDGIEFHFIYLGDEIVGMKTEASLTD